MWHDYEVWHQWHRWTLFCTISRNLLQACSTFCYTYAGLFNAVPLRRKVSHAFQINKCRRNKYQLWSSAVWMNIPANRAENPWWRYSCIISCHVDVTCFALMELSPSSICRCVLITSNGNVITAAVYNISIHMQYLQTTRHNEMFDGRRFSHKWQDIFFTQTNCSSSNNICCSLASNCTL